MPCARRCCRTTRSSPTCAWWTTRCVSWTSTSAPRPSPASCSSLPAVRSAGAPWAARRTSSRPAGRRCATAWSYRCSGVSLRSLRYETTDVASPYLAFVLHNGSKLRKRGPSSHCDGCHFRGRRHGSRRRVGDYLAEQRTAAVPRVENHARLRAPRLRTVFAQQVDHELLVRRVERAHRDHVGV